VGKLKKQLASANGSGSRRDSIQSGSDNEETKTVKYLTAQVVELKAALKANNGQSEVAQVLTKMVKTSTAETEFQAVRDELRATKLELEAQKAECTKLQEELKLKDSQLGAKEQQHNYTMVAMSQRNEQCRQLELVNNELRRQLSVSALAEENRQQAYKQCFTLRDQVEQKEKIGRILDRDLNLEKRKVKEITKLMKEMDGIYRHGLTQLRSEPSQLKVHTLYIVHDVQYLL